VLLSTADISVQRWSVWRIHVAICQAGVSGGGRVGWVRVKRRSGRLEWARQVIACRWSSWVCALGAFRLNEWTQDRIV
jgi:hypothetical protein